jgi:hypothetical protein
MAQNLAHLRAGERCWATALLAVCLLAPVPRACAAACTNPLNATPYRLGEGPSAHKKRMPNASWRVRPSIARTRGVVRRPRPAGERPPRGRQRSPVYPLSPCKNWRPPRVHLPALARQDTNAVDFLAPAGTPVYAVAAGVVCSPPACVVGKTEAEKRDRHSLNSFTVLGGRAERERA